MVNEFIESRDVRAEHCPFRETIEKARFTNGGGRNMEMNRRDFEQMVYDRTNPANLASKSVGYLNKFLIFAFAVLQILMAWKILTK
jgi:hypothetical protein